MKDVQPKISFAECERTHKSYLSHNQSVKATAESMGRNRQWVRTRLTGYEAQKPDLVFPDFPASDLPIERIIEGMKERSALQKISTEAHSWFPVKVNDKKPIGLMLIGDPHVDDDGCDWTLLSQHIEICKQPGVYAINIGDSTNNWAGRLVRLYANQETSSATARRLAEWFMLDSGIRWLVFLLGNHDAWADGSAILSEMAKRHKTQKLDLHDWEARFSLNFPNGAKINIWAAHDFPGDSQWNPIHGAVKAARFGPEVDLLVCGHKHNWGMSQWELADKGTTPTMIRVRGYKFNDDYARRIGKTEQKEGASILVIIDPNSKTASGKIITFVDVEKGANYLKFLRESL